MPSRNEVKDKVQRILSKNFATNLNNDGFAIKFGSAAVIVSIKNEPVTVTNEEIWMVEVVAPVLRDIELSDDLAREIATTNLRFGAVSFLQSEDQPGLIGITHTLIGNTLDEDELRFAVSHIGICADDLDDDWQIRFGGKKVSED